MSLGSSPGVYLRCSLNSTEKPWKGLACSPCRKPLTMNCARRSSRLIWRMTSGFRYCSAEGMGGLFLLSPSKTWAVKHQYEKVEDIPSQNTVVGLHDAILSTERTA